MYSVRMCMCGGVRVVAAGAIDVFKILPSSNSLIMIVSVSTEKNIIRFERVFVTAIYRLGFQAKLVSSNEIKNTFLSRLSISSNMTKLFILCSIFVLISFCVGALRFFFAYHLNCQIWDSAHTHRNIRHSSSEQYTYVCIFVPYFKWRFYVIINSMWWASRACLLSKPIECQNTFLCRNANGRRAPHFPIRTRISNRVLISHYRASNARYCSPQFYFLYTCIFYIHIICNTYMHTSFYRRRSIFEAVSAFYSIIKWVRTSVHDTKHAACIECVCEICDSYTLWVCV